MHILQTANLLALPRHSYGTQNATRFPLLDFFLGGGGDQLPCICHAHVCWCVYAVSRLPAVLSHNKHTDHFGSQQCLWAMQSGQAECPQEGPPPIHTELEQLGFCKPAFANWLLMEGPPALQTSNTAICGSREEV